MRGEEGLGRVVMWEDLFLEEFFMGKENFS